MRTPGKLALLLLAALFVPASTFAQGGATGALSGVVQDVSGAVIAGAKVSVQSEATGEVVRTLTTDSSGVFAATLLPVGTYSIAVNAIGFPATKFPGDAVRIAETTRMTVVMNVNVVREVVEVQSEVERVNTSDATTGGSLSAQTIADLPLATRNFQQLLALSAGATANLGNAAALRRGDARRARHGVRSIDWTCCRLWRPERKRRNSLQRHLGTPAVRNDDRGFISPGYLPHSPGDTAEQPFRVYLKHVQMRK